MLTERHGTVYRDVVRRMGRDGWLGVGWPHEYGGRGLGQVEQQIFVNEAARADVPLPAVTLQTVGPTLQAHGTAGAEGLLPAADPGRRACTSRSATPSRTRAPTWRRCGPRAVRDGDALRGQRPEDLHHRRPRRRLHLAGLPHRPGRASAQGHLHPHRRHHRPRATPGRRSSPTTARTTSTRPTTTTCGCRSTMRVGEENAGWRLITEQLNHERVMLGPGRPDRAPARPGARLGANGPGVLDQPDVRRALARTYASLRINELLNWQVAAAPQRSEIADASATKVFASERCSISCQVLEEIVRPLRRPGRRGDRRAGPLAGHSGQTEHGADLRRWCQRDPA